MQRPDTGGAVTRRGVALAAAGPHDRGSLQWDTDGRDWPNRQTSRFVDAGGLRWHVQCAGEGPVALLLHGTGASTHSWRGVLPLLAEHYTVVAPDLPGHGFSGAGADDCYSLPGMAGAVASLLAFTRPLYSDLIPAFSPAYAFLTCAIICFLIRPAGEHLMTWEYAQGKMMWGLFYLFAGGTALGRILSETGTAEFIADTLLPYASGGGFVAVMVFAGLTLLMTQITNNTAAVAITVPITISTFNSLDLNPLPFVYIVTTVGNCGFMLPTSAGGPAVAAGYGINLKTMAVKGFWACLIALVTCVVVGYALALYWPAFSTA